LRPGTNVAVVTALAHVIVTEGSIDEAFIRERCDWDEFEDYAEFVSDRPPFARMTEMHHRRSGGRAARGGAALCPGGNGAIYYGLGVTEHPGLHHGHGDRQPRHADRQYRARRRGGEPAPRPEQRAGLLRHGVVPARAAGLPPCEERRCARDLREPGAWRSTRAGPAHPQHAGRRRGWGTFKGLYCQGEDILQSDPDTKHVAAGLAAMECVIVHDLFLNETANYAHVFLPGSTFLEKDGTFTNAERRINRVRKVMAPKNGYADWEVTQMLAQAMGPIGTTPTPRRSWRRSPRPRPLRGCDLRSAGRKGSIQWPCNEANPEGSPIMHVDGFVRGKGRFIVTEYVATDEKTGPRFPLLLTTGRILSQYNVGAQTRRTENTVWHAGGPCWRSIPMTRSCAA
jgi:formate dehydrogenase major subunit